ncbi:hypothetical protein AB9M93_24850 [Peribacillus frigoritolerans]
MSFDTEGAGVKSSIVKEMFTIGHTNSSISSITFSLIFYGLLLIEKADC